MMIDVMKHNQEHPEIRPSDSLAAVTELFLNNQNQVGAQQMSNPQQGLNQPTINLPQGAGPMLPQNANLPGGQRTPGQMNMQPPNMAPGFMQSPAMQSGMLPGGLNGGASPHINFPGSNAHTPSPAQGHMQAPPMAHQMSQQGSTGSGASVNTSPNATGANKRRRQSAVKAEDDGGGPEVNGVAKVKASPRVGQNKRLKGS
jgi:hypothetical protein